MRSPHPVPALNSSLLPDIQILEISNFDNKKKDPIMTRIQQGLGADQLIRGGGGSFSEPYPLSKPHPIFHWICLALASSPQPNSHDIQLATVT